MNERQARLLKAIIDEFIGTALPVGSKQIVEHGQLGVSGATIRNEMQILSDEGFILQPHVSSGRVPTAKGYRVYVREYLQATRCENNVRKQFQTLKEKYFRHKDQERVYEAVALLTRMIPNIAFATVPHKDRVFYMGLGNVLRQPEFRQSPMLCSGIAEVLEEKLAGVLDDMEIDQTVRYTIGDENLLPQIQSCSMMVISYKRRRDDCGAIGILGPMRMDYRYNTVALELIADMLTSG